MTLNQIAQQAMDYLDSVGVAADYEIEDVILTVLTEDKVFEYACFIPLQEFVINVECAYPQKSPA